jgi:hypothetical protein
MNPTKLDALVCAYAMDMRYVDDGVTILGVPIGDNSNVAQYLEDKFVSIDRLLTLLQNISDICDVRLAFHSHRLCAQVCQLVHALRLTPPSQTLPRLPRFDAAQLRWYEKMSSIRLDTRAAVQVTLPLRHQGHGFVPTVSVAEPAFAANPH